MAEGTSNSGRTHTYFVWDTEKREVLGQPRSTCLKMLVGVILVTMASVVAISVALVMNTEIRPGLKFEPDLGDNMISFRTGQLYNDTFKYTRILEEIYDEYERKINSIPEGLVTDCSEYSLPKEGGVCRFGPFWITRACNPDRNWEYQDGSVCIFLTLNQVPGWVPEVYTSLEELPQEMPQQLRDEIFHLTYENQDRVPKMLWVSCTGLNLTASDDVKFGPYQGFPDFYFPYREELKDIYMSPITAVRIQSAVAVSQVEFRLWAKNIDHNDSAARLKIDIRFE